MIKALEPGGRRRRKKNVEENEQNNESDDEKSKSKRKKSRKGRKKKLKKTSLTTKLERTDDDDDDDGRIKRYNTNIRTKSNASGGMTGFVSKILTTPIFTKGFRVPQQKQIAGDLESTFR